jgi:hypothetical protein
MITSATRIANFFKDDETIDYAFISEDPTTFDDQMGKVPSYVSAGKIPLPPAYSWYSPAERSGFPLNDSRARDLRIPIRNFMLSRANHRLIAVLNVPHDDPTMQRLEDQIRWYDSHSTTNQWMFKVLKIIVIAAAALIPFLVGFNLPKWVVGGFGVLIAVLEGLQQLNQYHANWITYRSTSEALKHEKFLFLAAAGPYAAAIVPRVLLAERIESLVSQEHAKWASGQEYAERLKTSDKTSTNAG